MTVGDVASKYAARAGWAVFPVHAVVDGVCTCGDGDCGSPGKHPRTRAGCRDATSDVDVIRGWWDRWPDANVAVATGAVSGLVVVDVDDPDGLIALQVENGPLPETLWARTGGGGWHAYFQHPGGTVKCSAGQLASGVDVRADGGYVVAPPSRHVSGGIYRWHNRGQPQPLPGWLGGLLQPPPPEPREPVRLSGDLSAYVTSALDAEADTVAQAAPGTRNVTLNRAAFNLGQLVGAGQLDADTVRAVLLTAAHTCGLPEREAIATVRSGLSAGAREPREVSA